MSIPTSAEIPDRPILMRPLRKVAALVLLWGLALAPGGALAQRPLGIDVSSYQGSGVNWVSVKGSGRVFAWAKATEGATINDADFTINIDNGKAAGVYMGAYHYAHPELNTPATEASHFWGQVSSRTLADGLTLMPMLDIEGSAFSGHVGATSLSDWINTWCTDVVQDAANAGVSIKPCIYISACNACYLDSTVAQWFSDIANYGASNGYNDPQNGTPWSACSSCDVWGSGVWNFWQYASAPPDGSVPGVSGNCDVDVFNGTLAGLQSTMIATASSSSTIYYWDPQGTTGANPYTGSMTGNWEDSKWSFSSAGMSSPTNWTDGKAACFGVHTGLGTPAYTVTMNSSHVVAGFFDGALAPNSCDVTIQGSGIINLASGAQALDSLNSSDGSLGLLRINCVIAGDGQLVPEGNGQSFLHGANTYSGGTQIGYSTVSFSGIVNFNNGSAFGTGPITFTRYGRGGALVLEGSSAVTITNPVTVASPTTNNIVGNAAGLTFSGNWSLGANLFCLGTGSTVGNQTIISGVMSGSAGLMVTNRGTLVLSGVNTYSGTTTINSPAVFKIADPGQLGSGAYSGSIVNNGTFIYNSTASQTLSGVVSGSGPMIVNNSGQLALTGVNTYTGATIVSNGATVRITADSGLGGASASLTLNGGCLKNNNSAPTVGSSRTITLGANGGYLDAGWAPANPLAISSKLTGSGRLLIDLDGSPVVLGNTANDYTGNTIIGTNGPGYYASGSQAWLKLGASGVIPNGSGKGNVLIFQAYNGLLDLAGFTQTINGLSGDGTVDNSTGNGSLSVGNNNQSSTFAGVIQNSAGTLALTKVGSGTLTLASANTYNGATTVSAGTLALGAGGSIGVSAVTVAGSATLANTTTNTAAIGGTTTLSPGAFATFTAVGGNPSAVGKISIAGDLTLNNNALTINVSGAAVQVGSYRLFDSGGTVNGSANPIPTITGTALAPGNTATISTTGGSGGHVDLIINATPVFSGLTPSQSITYGTPAITLAGSVSAPGPLYPAIGDPVPITINGNTQPAAMNDATGDFSFSYNPSTIPANATPYPINYAYGGNSANFLNAAANDATTSLTVNPAASLTTLVSSQNPSTNGVSVTFTATVSGPGTPTGNVVFLTNNVPLATVALSGGIAAASTDGLPAGTNTIEAQYAAQANWLGSTNTLAQVVYSAITLSTTNGLLSIVDNGDGTFTLNCQGTPGAQYYVAQASDLAGSWTPLADSTNTASGPDGTWSLTVTNDASQKFYRSAAVNPAP